MLALGEYMQTRVHWVHTYKGEKASIVSFVVSRKRLNMFRWILPPIILALAVYPFLNKVVDMISLLTTSSNKNVKENCVLIILEVTSDAENGIKQLTLHGNIR